MFKNDRFAIVDQRSLDREAVDRQGPLNLSLVIPVYNEVAAISVFTERVLSLFSQDPSICVEFLFVNDGSTDGTLDLLLELQSADSRFKIIDLSRNFGKEAALSAGLDAAIGRAVIPIDVDLQDPPELIFEMASLWRQGYDVVLARRIDRSADSQFKRVSAGWFYGVLSKISDVHLPENVGDFRLMDRSVINALKTLPESKRFMKGLFAWVGFRTTFVDYSRSERSSGETKFNGWRLWNFALEGITSFSTDPLRIWTYLGFSVSLISFSFGVVIALRVLLYGVDTPGYASLIVAVTFFGGLQLIGIGILGEYLGRTYIEAKRRPVYLIRRTYESKSRD